MLQETRQFKIIPTANYLQPELASGILPGKYVEGFRAELNNRADSDVRWVIRFSNQERATSGLQM